MNVNDMPNSILDWAVLKAIKPHMHPEDYQTAVWQIPKYSTDWVHGGPVLESEGIEISPALSDPDRLPLRGWYAGRSIDDLSLFSHEAFAETALVAAMRVFVKFKIGEEIEIPKNLFKHL